MNKVLFVVSFALVLSTNLFAQKDGCADASDLRSWKATVLMNYQSAKPEEKKVAVDAAKKYVEKTGRCGIKDEFANWINSHLPDWDKSSALAARQTTASAYDAELAKKLGGNDNGMKVYVLCILKTGPNDSAIKGKERDDIFAGHMANIGRMAEAGKLAVAGPFQTNDKQYRGLYIFNVSTIEEAQKIVETDPAVKAGVFIPDLTVWYGSASLMATPEIHKRITKPQPKTN
jgi:uncharacterized protein YciI